MSAKGHKRNQALHSMTSSARERRTGDTAVPGFLAVLRLMANSVTSLCSSGLSVSIQQGLKWLKLSVSALPPKVDTDRRLAYAWRCYNALHESRRDRRSNRQVTAGSTRPLPSLVHRIRGGPRRSRQGARLHRDQTWPPRWPRVC
jgi:hypothetical protein